MAASPTREAIVTRNLRLPPGGLLADIACGRGGYSIENARRAGARLLGVDFSVVALDQRVLSPPGALRRVLTTATAP